MSRPSARDRVLAVGSAVVLSSATLWTVLVEARATVADPPEWVPGTEFAAFLESWYAWQAGTLWQERAALALLCVGLVAVAVSGVRLGRRGGTAQVSAGLAVAAGAVSWALVSIAQSAGHHAIEQMAASGNQIDAVNSIAFTLDTTAGWSHAAACALLATGLIALTTARTALLWRTTCLLGGALGWLFALLLLVETDTAKYVGLVLGAAVLPVWIAVAWLGRPEDESRALDCDVDTDEQASQDAPSTAHGRAAVGLLPSMLPMFPFRSFR
ncbi:MAG: hypothetical protein U0S36_06205 [Candidatus Nanopelagicales bacterium]